MIEGVRLFERRVRGQARSKRASGSVVACFHSELIVGDWPAVRDAVEAVGIISWDDAMVD